MDGSPSVDRRKQEDKKILSLGFITCKTIQCKALRAKLFEGGYHDMTLGGEYMGLSVHDMTLRGAYMGLSVHDMTLRGAYMGYIHI